MRTTLTIRDDLYEVARQRAFEERRSLGDVVSELMERGLADTARSTPRRLGAFAGSIQISEDFDDELPELTTAIDEPVIP